MSKKVYLTSEYLMGLFNQVRHTIRWNAIIRSMDNQQIDYYGWSELEIFEWALEHQLIDRY